MGLILGYLPCVLGKTATILSVLFQGVLVGKVGSGEGKFLP